MKTRRISAPEPVDGITYKAYNGETGETYESGDVVALIRRTVVSMKRNDEWTFTRTGCVNIITQKGDGTSTMEYEGVTYRMRHGVAGVREDAGLCIDVVVKGHTHTFTSWADLIEYRIAVPMDEVSETTEGEQQ